MDKTVVVTGGSRGIGKAVALAFAKRGDRVAILDLNMEAAEETAKECAALSGKDAKAYSCQVGDFANCTEVIDSIIKELGGVDVLINSAGITRDTLMLRMKEEEFDAVINVNLKGTFNMIKAAFKDLGYGDLKYAILNTKDYGIPQNRERLWMFAQLGGLPEDFSMVPPQIKNGLLLKDFVDENPPDARSKICFSSFSLSSTVRASANEVTCEI